MTRVNFRSRLTSRRLLALAVLAAAALVAPGCERALQVAPTSSTLVLTSSATTVALNGTITITATLTDSTGAGVTDGSLVQFTSSLGTVSPSEVRVTNGRVTATLQTGSVSGTATISATSGGVTSNSLSVRVGPVPSYIVMTTSISGTAATLLATVYDVTGAVVPGAAVTFTTTTGTISNAVVPTNSSGQASTTLYGSVDTVATATCSGVTASVPVRFVSSGALSVNITLSPTNPNRYENITFTATVGNTSVAIAQYEWTFNDGTTVVTTGNQTVRAYNTRATYWVSVRVVSVDGAVGTSRVEFFVE